MNSDLIDFISSLSTSDPEKLTATDIDKIRWYIKSDGCTGVPDICVEECIKHDFYFRTGVDFSGKLISFKDSNLRFFKGLWRKRHYILACIRWLGVSFTPQAKQRGASVRLIGFKIFVFPLKQLVFLAQQLAFLKN